MIDPTIQPIHELVYAATDGAALGDALEALPLEEMDGAGVSDFFQAGGVVFGALVQVDRPTAVEFREWARILVEAAQASNADAARVAKGQLVEIFGGLNGTWKPFRQHFDDRALRMNLFAPVAVATAAVQQAMRGEMNVRPVTVPQEEPLPLEQRKVLYMRKKLWEKSPQLVRNYEHILDTSDPTAFFETLAAILLDLDQRSEKAFRSHHSYDLQVLRDIGPQIEAIAFILPMGAVMFPDEINLFVQTMRRHSLAENPRELIRAIRQRIPT